MAGRVCATILLCTYRALTHNFDYVIYIYAEGGKRPDRGSPWRLQKTLESGRRARLGEPIRTRLLCNRKSLLYDFGAGAVADMSKKTCFSLVMCLSDATPRYVQKCGTVAGKPSGASPTSRGRHTFSHEVLTTCPSATVKRTTSISFATSVKGVGRTPSGSR